MMLTIFAIESIINFAKYFQINYISILIKAKEPVLTILIGVTNYNGYSKISLLFLICISIKLYVKGLLNGLYANY